MWDIQNWAFLTGLVLGSVAIGAVSYVWVRQQKFGSGGGMLSVAGIILIGLPFWSSLRFEMTGTGIRAEFERLRNEVQQVANATSATSEEVIKVARATEANTKQFVELTEQLEVKRIVDAASLRNVRESLVKTPQADIGRLEAASRVLKK
jgi:hypothetical protein